jgi:trans-2,3-dihydro-3-hydroxyanthranilate isomerase
MKLSFHTLDVFTDHRFGGNPLAVVHAADALSTQAMQTIAREFNLSETVFVLKPDNPAHSAKIRIFTPGQELPFAGHPTVGAGVLLAELRTASEGGSHDALVVLEETIGAVRIGVKLRPGSAGFAEFDAPRLPEPLQDNMETNRVAAALGLSPSEIGFENHRPSSFSAGVPIAFVPVASLAVMAQARPMMQHWPLAFPSPGPANAFLYCRESVRASSSFHARMFAPGLGVPEDPATGSAAAAFAAVVLRYDDLPDGHHERTIEQGFEMGRPSLIALEMNVAHRKLTSVRIGGHAVRVSEGTIEV